MVIPLFLYIVPKLLAYTNLFPGMYKLYDELMDYL